MNTLLLDRKNIGLELQGRRLLIREPDARPRAVPLKLIERIVVIGHAKLDTRLLSALGTQGIGIVLLSARRGRGRGYLSGPGHNDARRRLAQYELQADSAVRLRWSRTLIQAKTAAQRADLNRALQRRPDRRRPLLAAIGTLTDIALALLEADGIGTLRGLEGSAAAAYFRAYTLLFPASTGFTQRRRRPPPDPVNACLSLVYTLLHYEAVRACEIAGLDPLLGFFHEPAYGRESLACDLIEPLRPRADSWVWALFRERDLRAEHFSNERESYRLGKTGRGIFFAGYEMNARPWRRYLRLQAYGLAKQLLTLAPAFDEFDHDEALLS